MLFAACMAVWVGLSTPGQDQREVLRIDEASRVVIRVGKAGAFSFAGHPHTVVAPVAGTVTLDPTDPSQSGVVVEIDTASLRVTGEGEPAQDVPEVQRVMLSDRVLDAGRYPKIAFRSRRVTASGRAGAQLKLSVEGDLSLHGVVRRCVVPIVVMLSDGSLTAEGTTTIRQSDFGIKPVTAAGGTVRVKDLLDITFNLRATK